jgi:hypothetical protein
MRDVHRIAKRLVMMSVVIAAAATSAQTPLSRSQATPATTRFVAIGCISRESGGAQPFLITDMRGDKPSVYRLDGDPKELQLHVGHTVEITGPLSASSPATGPRSSYRVLKVGSLTYIAKTCGSK